MIYTFILLIAFALIAAPARTPQTSRTSSFPNYPATGELIDYRESHAIRPEGVPATSKHIANPSVSEGFHVAL